MNYNDVPTLDQLMTAEGFRAGLQTLNYSPERLAKRCRLNRSTVRRYCNGETPVSGAAAEVLRLMHLLRAVSSMVVAHGQVESAQ